uniref:MULE transposase domain-containing protein n=1 Tax=Meloidogyne enterolobii TaxID=390850 RepID=A0A6V7U562_MELEN|nr:unnamed protein product [Meloidogyne enterolobii]
MKETADIKQSPSIIRPKLEQIQRRSSPRKRPAPKIEESEHVVVDDIIEPVVPEKQQKTEEKVPQQKQEVVEFVRGFTNKGAICIWHNGFRYHKHYGTYWRCSNRKCPANATASEQEDGKIVGRVRNTHTHLPQPEQRLAEIKRQELRQRARDEPHISRATLIASIRAGIDDETFVALGTDASLSHMAYRERIKLYGKVRPNSGLSDVLDVKLPPALTERQGQSIFLYDSRTARARDKDAVFVFAHPYMLQQLAGQTTWAIGSSFKLAPVPFKHCFVIGALFRSQLIVAAHALLTENSEQSYIEALDAVASAIKPAKPRRIITDFENAMVVAAQNVFHDAHVTGCYFRFAQTLFKKWTEYNLGVIYGNEKSQAGNIARMTFRRLLCLALIPMAYVNRAFYVITEAAQLSQLSEFLFYFKRTFIGLTEHEYQMKAEAFGSNFGQNLIYSAPDEEEEEQHVYEEGTYEEHVYSQHIRYEMPPPHSSSTIIVANQSPAFLQPLRHSPYCPLEFWNISERASTALLNTNSAMEMAQYQIKQGTKQMLSLPDYIIAFWDDFERQRDNIRSVAISNKKRNRKYIIKEELVASTLNEASYETDQAILNTLDMLSHHVQGYVNGLHFDVKNEKRHSQEQQQSSCSIENAVEFNESLNNTGGGHIHMDRLIFDSPTNMKPSTSGFR